MVRRAPHTGIDRAFGSDARGTECADQPGTSRIPTGPGQPSRACALGCASMETPSIDCHLYRLAILHRMTRHGGQERYYIMNPRPCGWLKVPMLGNTVARSVFDSPYQSASVAAYSD